MTTTVSPRGTATGSPLSFGGVLNSEWIKLRSLRSTEWCYLIMVVLTIGLGLLIALAVQQPQGDAAADNTQQAWLMVTTLGISFSQLVSAVLGALVITGEYSTGMIRSTFAAVPTRIPAIIAKVLVFGVTTFVVTLFSLAVAALLSSLVLTNRGFDVDISDGRVWLALVGGAAYVALIGVISLGIGLIVRSSAGGIAGALGLVLVVPIILQVVSGITQAKWPLNVAAFLPSNAGARLYAFPMDISAISQPGIVTLESWQALLVVVGWCVLTVLVGSILVKRRDA